MFRSGGVPADSFGKAHQEEDNVSEVTIDLDSSIFVFKLKDNEEKIYITDNHIKMVAFGNPISNLFKKTSNNKEIKNSYD